MKSVDHVHTTAIVEAGASVEPGAKVGAFTHILSGASIGADCDVRGSVVIGGNVRVGSRVTLESGVRLVHGVHLDDDVHIGANATFSNGYPGQDGPLQHSGLVTVVGRGASIGPNATVQAGTTIGPGAVVRAGAVVTRDVPPNSIVHGNPALIVGYVDTNQATEVVASPPELPEGEYAGARLIRFPVVEDIRGCLTFAQTDGLLPFEPARVFVIYGVPSGDVRGEHAHRDCHQLLVATSGSLSVVVDDGHTRVEIVLSDPSVALHIPPMIWATEYKYSSDATLMVLASHHYEADDYIRDYAEFLDAVG